MINEGVANILKVKGKLRESNPIGDKGGASAEFSFALEQKINIDNGLFNIYLCLNDYFMLD